MSVEIDFSELIKLATDLGAAPAKAHANIRKAVEVTARNVRDAWREPLRQSTYVPRGAFSVSYDIEMGADGVRAEIGPEIGGSGALVGMLEYGTPTVGPTGYGHRALQLNEEDFQQGLAKALEDSL